MHAQDGRLRRVDDGRGQQAAVYAAIRDGEGAPGHLINANGSVPRLLAQTIDGLHNIGNSVPYLHLPIHMHRFLCKAMLCQHPWENLAERVIEALGLHSSRSACPHQNKMSLLSMLHASAVIMHRILVISDLVRLGHLLDLCKAQGVHISQHWHDQALGRGNCD